MNSNTKTTAMSNQPLTKDLSSRDKLITSNMPFVISEAKKYMHRGLSLEDLIGEGYVGLIKAADKYDERLGVHFVTHATWWIRDAIMHAIEEYGHTIRLPHGQQQVARRILSFKAQYLLENGTEASIYDIAEGLGLSLDKMLDIYASIQDWVSLDNTLYNEEGCNTTLLDQLGFSEEEMTDLSSLHSELQEAIQTCLDRREIYIISHLYGFGSEETRREEIAEELGISTERVRQIRKEALLKLRDYMTSCMLRPCC